MANKKITDATTATSVAGTDKVFLNQGGDLKQVDLNSAVANSQAVQTLNSNLDLNTSSYLESSNTEKITISNFRINKKNNIISLYLLFIVNSDISNNEQIMKTIYKPSFSYYSFYVYDIKNNFSIVTTSSVWLSSNGIFTVYGKLNKGSYALNSVYFV